MFSVALIFINQWLKSHSGLQAQCLSEISFVQFDQKIIKNIKHHVNQIPWSTYFALSLKTKTK